MSDTTQQQPTPDCGEPWTSIDDKLIYFPFVRTRNDEIPGNILSRRAIDCVNACAGMVDPLVEIQAMREAIQSATSALEDWQLLWREIRGQQSSRAHQDGAAVNTATAAALTKLQPFLKS